MNLLDENIRKDQEDLLRTWRVKVRRLSREVAHPGIQDSDILTLLHQLKRSTFFTHDEDFWKRRLAHKGYCLVWLNVHDGEAALFIRRFLRHPRFSTQVQRMGKVVRIQPTALRYWEFAKSTQVLLSWEGS